MLYENECVAKIISKDKITLKLKKNEIQSSSQNKILNELLKIENQSEIKKGWYDFFSLKARYIDYKLYEKYLPEDLKSQKFFKILLEVRSICIGFSKFIGCKINVEEVLNEIVKTIFSDAKNSEDVFFKYFLDRFQGVSNNLEFEEKFPMIKTKSVNDLLKNFKKNNEFYENAKKISQLIKSSNIENKDQKKISKNTNQEKQLQQKGEKKIPFQDKKKQEKKSSDKREFDNINKSTLNKEQQSNENYKIFTKEFDISKNAKKLVEFKELNELRKKFDEECKDYTKLINKLVKKLKTLLLAFDSTAWKFSQDEGSFDGSRFAAFIANNNNSSIYKLEKRNIEKNTVVSLLMDNSGSMRGKPIITSALTAEILTQTLEKCNVNVEILGFTTKEWKGGSSKKKWEKYDKPKNPGRLNDLLHIVYKDADVSWSFAKKNLGLILKEGLLKENIDGEALLWASQRLKERKEKKKILIVISDGAPVDDSTLSVNYPYILENHLKKVVSDIECENKINLVAIGIGHDVSKYYKKAFTIDSPEKLGDIIIENLAENLKE